MSGIVGEGEGVRTLIAKPDFAVIAQVIKTLARHANVGHMFTVISPETCNKSVTAKASFLNGMSTGASYTSLAEGHESIR